MSAKTRTGSIQTGMVITGDGWNEDYKPGTYTGTVVSLDSFGAIHIMWADGPFMVRSAWIKF